MAYSLIVVGITAILLTAPCNSIPSTVNETVLTEFMTSLWQADVNRASDSDITLALQATVSNHSATDNAPSRLFAHVNPAVLQRSTYAALVALLDTTIQAEIDSYLNALTNTPVMRRTYEFLKNRGYVGQSMPDFREKMKSLWFTLYPRSSRSSHHQQDSSGFEHTFSGETYSNKVTGFHNWVRFYLEEKSGHIITWVTFNRNSPTFWPLVSHGMV
ncbi:hypothetical protein ScPMuIL_003827 [Solemya velum]